MEYEKYPNFREHIYHSKCENGKHVGLPMQVK